MLPEKADVAVIGSGISGLSYSFYLSKLRPDVNIKIFEASGRSGGYIYSKNSNVGGIEDETTVFEKGPRTLRSASVGTSLIVSLFKDILHRENEIFGIGKKSKANRKYILDTTDQLAEVPYGSIFSNWKLYFDFFTKYNITERIFSNVLKEPFRPKTTNKNDESVESFLSRRFGTGIPANIVSAIYHGIFAGDIAKLSADCIMKPMRDIEIEQKKSIIFSGFTNLFKTKQKNILPDELLSIRYQQFILNENNGENIKKITNEVKKYPIICFKNGLETVTKAYTEELSKMENVEFIRNCDAKQLIKKDKQITVIYQKESKGKLEGDNFDLVNSTISSKLLANLLAKNQAYHNTVELLNSIAYSKVLLVNIYINGKDFLSENPGFGYLVPKSYYYKNLGNNYKAPLLGVIFDSDTEKYKVPLFVEGQASLEQEQKSPYTKLTAMMGGYMWPENSSVPEMTTCISDLKKQLEKAMKLNLDNIKQEDLTIEASMVSGDGIPQYNVGFSDLKKKIEKDINLEFDGRLKLSGMCFNGSIGVPDCVSHGFELALEDSGMLTDNNSG